MDTYAQAFIDHIAAIPEIPLSAIFLRGSRISGQQTDFWSDTDLLVVVEADRQLAIALWRNALEAYGDILGQESFVDTHTLVLRLVLAVDTQIVLLDLSVWTRTHWERHQGEFTAPLFSCIWRYSCPSACFAECFPGTRTFFRGTYRSALVQVISECEEVYAKGSSYWFAPLAGCGTGISGHSHDGA